MIKIKSTYEPVENKDGFRILVDNICSKDLSKETIQLDLSLKEIAPSNDLKKWFANDPERWPEFQKKYRKELRDKKTLINLIRNAERKNGTVTLIYAAKDDQHNNAVILRDKLQGYKTISTQINRTHGA